MENGHAPMAAVPHPGPWVMRVTLNTEDAPSAELAAQLAVEHLRTGGAFELKVFNQQSGQTDTFHVDTVEPTPPVEAAQNRQLLGKILGAIQAKALGATSPDVMPALQALAQEINAAVLRKPPILVVRG